MGQGVRTVFTELTSTELGIAPDRITIVMGDTAIVPFDSSTSASRSTVFMGNAILKACRDIKAQLTRIASEEFDTPQESIRIGDGLVHLPGRSLTYSELLRRRYGSFLGEIVGMGSEHSASLPNHPLGGKPAFWEFMCAAAEVEVDTETGAVQVLRLILASDVGKALNPAHVEAQDEGAAVMGLGHTLMEHLILDPHGRIVNLGALDYRIPTIQDIPVSLESVLIENGDGPGPFGAKGAGEGGILAVASAVASAVTEASGAVLRDLPLTPESVWRALQHYDQLNKG
jgi:CO/xanthine dehydrogenase Mo-binding subunit